MTELSPEFRIAREMVENLLNQTQNWFNEVVDKNLSGHMSRPEVRAKAKLRTLKEVIEIFDQVASARAEQLTSFRPRVDSYDQNAPTPEVGSTWIWEPSSVDAREVIRVTAVVWNGEEWWVKTRGLVGRLAGEEFSNDLSRFWEAVVPYEQQAS